MATGTDEWEYVTYAPQGEKCSVCRRDALGGGGTAPDPGKESIRRPPGQAPTATSEKDVADRYREAVAVFPTSDVPPSQTAHWLMKPPSMIRGTWQEPKDAGEWLGLQLTEFAPRFASEEDREVIRLVVLVKAAVGRLTWGGDVSLGHYLSGIVFHSVAVVTCSPNRAAPELLCPARQAHT